MAGFDLESELNDRELSITIHSTRSGWVVWLFPADDPGQMIVGEGRDLFATVRKAFAQWDGPGRMEDAEHLPPLVATKLPGGGRGWRKSDAVLEPGEEFLVPVRGEDGVVEWIEKTVERTR